MEYVHLDLQGAVRSGVGGREQWQGLENVDLLPSETASHANHIRVRQRNTGWYVCDLDSTMATLIWRWHRFHSTSPDKTCGCEILVWKRETFEYSLRDDIVPAVIETPTGAVEILSNSVAADVLPPTLDTANLLPIQPLTEQAPPILQNPFILRHPVRFWRFANAQLRGSQVAAFEWMLLRELAPPFQEGGFRCNFKKVFHFAGTRPGPTQQSGDAERKTVHTYDADSEVGFKPKRGAILAEAVGFGKTAVALSLVAGDLELLEDYPQIEQDDTFGHGKYANFYDCSRTTLILVPPHLLDQWRTEIQKFLVCHIACSETSYYDGSRQRCRCWKNARWSTDGGRSLCVKVIRNSNQDAVFHGLNKDGRPLFSLYD